MPHAYVLHSATCNRYYISSTKNLSTRIKDHNAGKVHSTKAYRPWDVIYTEQYDSYSEARKRELFLKSGAGRKWLKERFTV